MTSWSINSGFNLLFYRFFYGVLIYYLLYSLKIGLLSKFYERLDPKLRSY